MMNIFNNIGSNNVDQSLYSTISELPSFHDDQEPVTTSTSSFADHLYPPASHQDHPQPIFVQIPICHNTNHQISRQQTNEIKSEMIKSEVENVVATSLPSTQSTICTQSSTATTTIPIVNICSTQQQTPSTLITARPKSSIKCFKCTQCPFISISQTGLDVHTEKDHHNGKETLVFKKLKCFGCQNVFYSKNSLKVHLVKDHQMSEDEINYLVQNSVLDGENVDDSSLSTPIKQKIYLKNLSILKAPEFRGDDRNEPESFDNFNEVNHYAKEDDQNENQNPQPDLYDDVPDDFINLIDDEFSEQNDDLIVENSAPNDFQSKIFVKDVNILKNSHYTTTGHQFLFDGVQDFRDGAQQILIETPPPIAQGIRIQNQNFSPNYSNSINEMQPKKKPCKIFIKNVDILPKPIILQTSGNSFISTSPQPQPLYSTNYIIPFGKQAHSTFLRTPGESTSFMCSSEKSLTENHLSATNQQKKIFIKNIDILKEPVAKKSMLHLRTVDDINLMNVNESPNIPESFQDDTTRVQSIIDNSNENYNEVEDYSINNDQCLESVIDDFVNYYQNNETDRLQFPFPDMHTVNFQTNSGTNNSDFRLDSISVDGVTNHAINLENITDSTTSSIDEKAVNKTEQMNGNNEAQMYYDNCEEVERNAPATPGIYDYEKAFDEEILFVCAEEVINSCEQNRDQGTTTPNDERLTMESNCGVSTETTQDAKEMSKQEEPVKGRIYVVSNLMKTTSDSDDSNKQSSEVAPDANTDNQMVEVIESNDEEDVQCINTDNTKLVQVFLLDSAKKTAKRKKAVGRPKGGRNNRYTLNSINSKDNSAIKYQCTQNCAMRFSSSKVFSFHEQCHDQSQKNRIVCPKCKDNFRNFNTLHTHLWRQHSIDMELYSCEQCDFKTPILSRLLNTHMKIHGNERNYKCEIETCDKAFKNAKQLKNHRALHNEVRVIRKCEFCDKLFFNKKYLRNHVKSVHEMLNEFKCIVCDNIFSSVVACRTHMLNHTNMSKKFQCEKCSYSSNDGSGFRRHLKTHENTRTYECRSCPFRCIQSKQFKNHILKLHPDIANDVLFSCTKCPFVTVNRSKFDLHQLHHEFKEA